MLVEIQTRDQQEWLPTFTPSAEILKEATPAGVKKEGYYGLPMLKRPTWEWEIAWYFFLEGVSAGSYLIASLAARSGDKRLRPVKRAGHYTALLAFLPCPLLLIADLGDPARFHHMLRVFKPSSPMNLGAWALSAYGLPLTLLAAKQFAEELPKKYRPVKLAARLIPARLLGWLGLPLSLTMASYTGVLLAATSVPLWATSRCLGALFATNAINNGVAATSLHPALHDGGARRALQSLERVERIARLSEAVAIGFYLVTTGKAAKPLMKGRCGWQFWLGAVGVGLVAPAMLQAMNPKRRKQGRVGTILRSALSLVGGFALKWAIVHAGRASANDVESAQHATRPTRSAPGAAYGAGNSDGDG
jgi:formate-dependent nitrite reductase membrane component NrfD